MEQKKKKWDQGFRPSLDEAHVDLVDALVKRWQADSRSDAVRRAVQCSFQYEDAHEGVCAAQDALEQARNECRSLRNELEAYAEVADEVERDLRAQLTEVTQKLSEQRVRPGGDRYAVVVSDRDKARAERDDYQRRLEVIAASYDKLEKDRDEYKRAVAACASERDAVHDDVSTLLQARAEAVKTLVAAGLCGEWGEFTETLHDKIAQAVAAYKQAKDRISELEQLHHNTVEAQAALRREALAALVDAGLCDRDTMPLQEGVNQACDRHQTALELAADNADLKAQVDKADKQIADLRARVKERNDDLDKAEDRLAGEQVLRERAENQVKNLYKQKSIVDDDLKKVKRERDRQRVECSKLEVELKKVKGVRVPMVVSASLIAFGLGAACGGLVETIRAWWPF